MEVDGQDATKWRCRVCEKTLKGKPAMNHAATKMHKEAVRKQARR